MKKKLLSLVLAGAMVASTSVSAFATTEETVVTDNNGAANVTINGSVDANNGDSPAGTINVSIPTSVGFSVNKDGRVNTGTISITNRGAEAVDITAFRFEDQTYDSNITVKTPAQFDTDSGTNTRADLVLSIAGSQGERAYFKSEAASDKKNGIYDLQGDNQGSGIKIATVKGSGGTDTLTLTGTAGTGQLTNDTNNKGVIDNFVLTLKISKANN